MQRKTTITALLCLVAAATCLCAGCGKDEYNPQKCSGLFMAQQYDQALEIARKDAEDYPENYNAQYNLGLALAYNLKPAEAVAAFDRAIALDPKQAEAHSQKAFCLIATDKEDDAKIEFEKALKCYQYRVEASVVKAGTMVDCAVCLFFLGRRDEALEMCKESIKLKNDPTTFEKQAYIEANNEFGQLYPDFVKKYKGEEWVAKKQAEAKTLNEKLEAEKKAKEAAEETGDAPAPDAAPDTGANPDEAPAPDAGEDTGE